MEIFPKMFQTLSRQQLLACECVNKPKFKASYLPEALRPPTLHHPEHPTQLVWTLCKVTDKTHTYTHTLKSSTTSSRTKASIFTTKDASTPVWNCFINTECFKTHDHTKKEETLVTGRDSCYYIHLDFCTNKTQSSSQKTSNWKGFRKTITIILPQDL